MQIDDQRRQIFATDGHLLIVGGPGCGKTTIALAKANLEVPKLKPEQRILFLSFSRAAVRQIAGRMDGLLSAASRSALEVRTFHAFFMELVRSHGRLLTGQPSRFIAPDRERLLRADFAGAWPAEQVRLASQEARFAFDRLAPTAAELLERSPTIRALYSDIYPLVIVDEFQDTNRDQWRAVRALSYASTVICLADPDQRIFGYLDGVDEDRIDHAIDDLKPTQFDLTKDNFRSPTGGLLDYANAVLRNTPHQRPDSIRLFTYPIARRGSLWQILSHRAVVMLRDHLTVNLGRTPTIAVLARTNNIIGQLSEALSTDTVTGAAVLPAVEHELMLDFELTAAAGQVIASIMEWPGLARQRAITTTLRTVADFYRVKLVSAAGAREKIDVLKQAISAFEGGATVRAKTAKTIIAAYDEGLELTGDPVSDWVAARTRLAGSAELSEVFKHARLLRLLKATDALAWALTDAWDGQGSYTDAAAVVREVLADEVTTGSLREVTSVSLMNMHRSKGKEFDGVVIVEPEHGGRLLDPNWEASRTQAERRLLRVAITRARHMVVFVRPEDGVPLVPAVLKTRPR